MGTRYSRRTAAGTSEYHDSEESMIASARREQSLVRAEAFGVVGLLAGGVLTYLVLHKIGMDWPRWSRFILVIAGSGVLAYVMAVLADLLWTVILATVLLILISGLGMLLWKVV